MTPQEKIRHLYRRFGFGATPEEVETGVKRGVERTLRDLIEYDAIPAPAIHPYEFAWREKEEPDLGAYRFRLYWIYRMLTTHRPLEERLTLFWHNHFAVSDAKVEDGPMMLQYLETLRNHAAGRFGDILAAVSKEPAMMRYLDMSRSISGNPNENFAREVMELFTLGIGNYTEHDVQEAARAFTGWGYLHIFYELPGNTEQKLRDAIRFRRPFSGFAPIAAMHDAGDKTILGQTAAFDGDSFLTVLAEHPVTARRMVKKLWEHFAYEDPEPEVLDRITRQYTSTKGNIRRVMFAIARSPEFWSDRCVRRRIKSPVDLCLPIARQMGIGTALQSMRAPHADAYTRLDNRIHDELGGLSYHMERQGLNLLYPPDVSGWRWGNAWASPAMMAERYQFRGSMIWGPHGSGMGTRNVLAYVQTRAPKSTTEIAQAMADLFDVPVNENSLRVLTQGIESRGGMRALKDPNSFTGVVERTLKLLMAAPETHLG